MTYSIYAIRNTVNDMRYIGLTNDLHRRRKEHFSKLKCDNHVNRYLQSAYNKYGHESFLWEILETDIEVSDIAKLREIYWIACFENTYNLTEGGDGVLISGHAKITLWNGIEYKSIADAARALGISRATMQERLNNGYVCDADVTGISSLSIKMEWEGVIYPTIAHAARAAGIPNRTMQSYSDKGIHRADDIPVSFEKVPFEWNGIWYETMSDAARALGVDAPLIRQWRDKGWKSDNDRREKNNKGRIGKKVVWNGVIYPTLKIAAEMNGVAKTTMRGWLNNGWQSDKDVQFPDRQKKIRLKGKVYASIHDAAQETGHSRSTIQKWIKEGKVLIIQ